MRGPISSGGFTRSRRDARRTSSLSFLECAAGGCVPRASQRSIYRVYNGYWFWGRPSPAELWADLGDVTSRVRPDWDLSAPGLREDWEGRHARHGAPDPVEGPQGPLCLARDRRGLRLPGVERLAGRQSGRLAVHLAGGVVTPGRLFREENLERVSVVPALLPSPGEDRGAGLADVA